MPTMSRGCGLALFDTGIGRCGVAWGPDGLVAVQLPERNEAETVARLTECLPDGQECTPPPEVQAAIVQMVALLAGQPSDLSAIALDMTAVPPFHRRVYQMARTIPPGDTLSYGEVAARLGSPGAARAVGQALRRNPFAIVVPCHRVVAAGGKIGGFSARGGLDTKVQMLALEAPPTSPAIRPGFDTALAGKLLRAADPVLAVLMDAVGPFDLQLSGAPSVFAALAEALIHQQLNGRAAGAIYGRLRALFPSTHGEGLTPEKIVTATDADLLSAGLSRAKLAALRDLADRTLDGTIPTLAEAQSRDDEAIVTELSQVRGIGPWTSEMFLIFTLGRPDVLPGGDLGIRRGFGLTYGTGERVTPTELLAFGERWRPYRTVASWYLWQALELDREGRRHARAGG